MSYVNEEKVKTGIQNFILENWKKSKKEFRYINRVQFTNENMPFIIDLSIDIITYIIIELSILIIIYITIDLSFWHYYRHLLLILVIDNDY